MTALSLPSPATEALVVVRSAFPEARIALVGAEAIGCHIRLTWRTTSDLDLAIAVADATQGLSRLKGWVQSPRKEHEWRAPNGLRLDILPISPEALRRGFLTWPKSGQVMSVAGFRQALAAESQEFAPGLRVCLPALPVLALLKMAAFLDRPADRGRDLEDFAQILNEYPSADDDRLFTNPAIQQLSLNVDESQAFVLGQELGTLVDDSERKVVAGFLARLRGLDAARFVRAGPWSRFEPEPVEARVRALAVGFTCACKQKDRGTPSLDL